MNSRSLNKHILILGTSPGAKNKDIHGAKLPTFKQVLLCYLANMENLRNQDTSRIQKLRHKVVDIVVKNIIPHYHTAGIQMKANKTMKDDVIKLHNEYMTIKKSMRQNKILQFQEKIKKIMPFWKKDALSTMELTAKKPRLNNVEKMLLWKILTFKKHDE